MDQPIEPVLSWIDDEQKTLRSAAKTRRKSRHPRIIAASALLLMLAMSSAAMSSPARASAAAASLAKAQADRIEANRAGWTAVAAEAAGLPVEQLVEKLSSGATPAEAASLSDDRQDKLIRDVYEPWETELQQQVSSGELTEAQADAQRSALLSAARGLVTGEWN